MPFAKPLATVALPTALALSAAGQIATSNEKGATGAYSSDVESSFTSEGRFGPRTAIDDLRAHVDRDREQIERVRQQQLQAPAPPPPEKIEPFLPGSAENTEASARNKPAAASEEGEPDAS